MIRNIILLVLLSFVVVFWASGMVHIVNFIHDTFDQASSFLSVNIGGYQMGAMARHILALILIPLLAAILLRLAFWLMRKQNAGFIAAVTWGVWLVLTTILLLRG